MEKCDIFSLGLIIFRASLGLTEPNMDVLEINVIDTNDSEVLSKMSKVIKRKYINPFFYEIIKNMCNGSF